MIHISWLLFREPWSDERLKVYSVLEANAVMRSGKQKPRSCRAQELARRCPWKMRGRKRPLNELRDT
jgi:hypothetical protein